MDEELIYLIDQLKKDPMSGLTLVNRSKKSYLTMKNDFETNIYILIDGVVIISLVGLKNQYHFMYLNRSSIVTILGAEDESVVKQPFDILVDSNEAQFYKIDRKIFWKIVNGNPRIGKYIRNYYRNQLQVNFSRLRQQLSNDRKGQICAFIYEAVQLFGVESPKNTNYILIDHKITHGTIGKFIGASQRSSVSRIITNLINDQIIESKSGYITVKNLAYLNQYVNKVG